MLYENTRSFNLLRKAADHPFPLALLLAGSILANAAGAAEFSFPLKVSRNGRFLVDQQEKPFLVVGDTAWSIIAQLKADDVRRYLDDRQAQGFNSILVNLIEHKFASKAPRNVAGEAPFRQPESLAEPNDAYFDYAQWVVQEANQRGIVVWLTPAYLGYGGGDEGWFKAIKASGPRALRDYGRYVGRRFRKLPNVVWVMAGDYTLPPSDQWTVDELAAGIGEECGTCLITAHGAPGRSAVVSFPDRAWLNLNMAYSYETNLYTPLLAEYQRRPARPFVLLESTYENEHDSRPEQIRRQAYWAMLRGACGQFLGNNPIWHFDGPGLFKAPGRWQEALRSQGSRDVARLGKLFAGRAWYRLEPEFEPRFLMSGLGTGVGRATAAVAPDGSLAMVYLPSTGTEARAITVDLANFQRPVAARWLSPVTGESKLGAAAPLANHARHTLKTPGDNGSGVNDWLLVLEKVDR